MNPIKRFENFEHVKDRGPSAALRRHCRWIKDLQVQVREEKEQAEQDTRAGEDRKQRLQAIFKERRDMIRRIKSERGESLQRHEVEAIMGSLGADMRPKRQAQTKASKPLWAMTEQERDSFEEEEAKDLINFAEGLDFDRYIGDFEFRECLQAVTDRANKLQREQDAFKDDLLRQFNEGDDEDAGASARGGSPRGSQFGEGLGGVSVLSSEDATGAGRRRRVQLPSGETRPDWDTSTAYGEDRPPNVDGHTKAAADVVLETNPQLRGIHSKTSMQRIVERAREGTPSSLPVS